MCVPAGQGGADLGCVRVLARGANLTALTARGVEIRTPEGTWTAAVAASDDVRDLGPVDAAIVAVKSYSLAEIAPTARALAELGALVIPLLNGVDAAERLAALGVPRTQVLGGVTYMSAARVAPGVVELRSPFQRVLVGELPEASTSESGTSPRGEAVATALREAGVDAQAVADIGLALWQKFVFLVSLSAACGLARSAIGPLRRAPLGALLIDRAVREAAAVGRACGIALPADEEARVLARIAELPDAMQPSFLLDVLRGGPTELDVLSGAVSRLGAETGVPTPMHDTATAALGVPRTVRG